MRIHSKSHAAVADSDVVDDADADADADVDVDVDVDVVDVGVDDGDVVVADYSCHARA